MRFLSQAAWLIFGCSGAASPKGAILEWKAPYFTLNHEIQFGPYGESGLRMGLESAPIGKRGPA